MILANGCNITKSEKFKGVWILSVPTVEWKTGTLVIATGIQHFLINEFTMITAWRAIHTKDDNYNDYYNNYKVQWQRGTFIGITFRIIFSCWWTKTLAVNHFKELKHLKWQYATCW